MNKRLGYFIGTLLLCLLCAAGCSETPSNVKEVSELPDIYPDYKEVTIPLNIAPLNFRLPDEMPFHVEFSANSYRVEVSGTGCVQIPIDKWRKLLHSAKGSQIAVTVCSKREGEWIQYTPFNWHVSSDSIDSHLVYRLIEPTYVNWNRMGIYQRDLTSFSEKEIISNDKTDNNCINCHAFNQHNPDEMVFHSRKMNPGTLLLKGGKVQKLQTKTNYTISNFVYPYWHPSGGDIAFSTNNTQMSFYEANQKKIEVYDLFSDIVIYNIQSNQVYSSPLLTNPEQLENFPLFSPDGKQLYFCTCPRVDSMPQQFSQVKYRLCSLGFDAESQTFATKIDTLIDLTPEGKGISLPSISPNGRYILCSVAESGCFLSWDKTSDLYLYDTHSRQLSPASALNTDDSESYTSWSSNSHWIIFSSRRVDGVYTHPYIAHIDAEGKIGKPFLLPQLDPNHYLALFKSYNLPQLIKGEVSISPHTLSTVTRSPQIKSVEPRQQGPAPTLPTEEKSEVN